MELFDEDFQKNEKTDSKKATTIILAVIIFLIVMVLFVVGTMIFIKQTALVVKVNGETANNVKNMIIIDEYNPQKVYVPIRKIAKILGYSDFSGSYMTKSEENNQCYVECENEVAMFSLGSNKIFKKLTNDDSGYEVYTIDEPVKAINGELYTTTEGIKTAFNIIWLFSDDSRKMNIYTMPYLVDRYSTSVINLGYDTISEDFTNQKAVLGGWIIAETGKDKSNKKVAVLSVENGELQTLLEPKYEDIDYLERTQDFLITAGGKKGIITNTKTTKVKPVYDDIKLMDYDKKLYVVKSTDRYGIIDFNGKVILDTYYNKIGIDDIDVFKENDIRSKYILADELIPVQKDRQWGFFDIKGKQVTDFKYDNLGYITSNNRASSSGYSLLVVPEYNVIVVGKEKKYNVITVKGEEVWPQFFFDSIYLSIDEGKTEYILEIDKNTYNLISQLEGLGYGKNNAIKNNTNEQSNNDVQEQSYSEQQSGDNQKQENNEQQSNDNYNQNNNEQQSSDNQSQNYNERQNSDNQDQENNQQQNNNQ